MQGTGTSLLHVGSALGFFLAWGLVLRRTVDRKIWSWVIVLGLVLLSVALAQTTLNTPLRFGFAQALAMCAWLSILLLLLDRQVDKSRALWRMLLPFAVVASLLPVMFSGAPVDASRPWFGAHLMGAVFSYSLILLATGLALIMAASEKSLHSPGLDQQAGSGWLSDLPPLLVLERLMFRVTATGFVALSLTLISGFVFSEQVFGRSMRFDHKTVFAIAAWLVFATLLIGRVLWGWRGKRAVRFTLSGFGLLLLAYVGTHFVLEVVLKRGLV